MTTAFWVSTRTVAAGAISPWPDAKPRTGLDLGVVLLDVDVLGSGQGEMAPAATVRVDTQNAVVRDDYGAEVVRLSKISRK